MNNISVIIPTKDRSVLLNTVISSYLSQDYLLELIIVDDASTDETRKVVNNFIRTDRRVKYIKNAHNMGVPATRNIGVRNAKGKYIFFGEDDLVLTKDFFRSLSLHMKKQKANIIAGRRINIRRSETQEQALKRANKLETTIINSSLLITNCEINAKDDQLSPLLDASMLIEKSVFDFLHFDELYKGNFWREESDFQINAYAKGLRIVFCPHVVCYHQSKLYDRGGCHSSNQLIYEYWVLINNLRFVNKNWNSLKVICLIKNRYVYLLTFLTYRFIFNLLLPTLIFNINKLKSK